MIHDRHATHANALGQRVGQALVLKMNRGKARALLVFFGYKKSFTVEVGNLVVCFELNVA